MNWYIWLDRNTGDIDTVFLWLNQFFFIEWSTVYVHNYKRRFFRVYWFYVQSVSQNLTEIHFTNALDLGKVLWNGRYYKIFRYRGIYEKGSGDVVSAVWVQRIRLCIKCRNSWYDISQTLFVNPPVRQMKYR